MTVKDDVGLSETGTFGASNPVGLKLKELNPELFTWDSYENDYGARLGLDFRESTEMRTMEREIKKRSVGYCQGSRLSVMPKSDMYGLMLEDDDGEKFWFHYPRTCLDHIMEGIDWSAVDRLFRD